MGNVVIGWDTSHYDGRITPAIASRARSEGIQFMTHKIGEGTGGRDELAREALSSFMAAGVEVIGGYHVVRSGPVSPQVDAFIRMTTDAFPDWRSHPGWFWQVDLERWPYDNVSARTGLEFADLLADRVGQMVVLYASRGQYGDELSAWNGPLWNADYGTSASRPGPAGAMYPGDDYRGWRAYSGKAPTFLQYTSSATIAGLTTCDANAFKGTLADLKALIRGGTPEMTSQAENAILATRDGKPKVDGQTNCPVVWEIDRQKWQESVDLRLSELKDMISALAGTGGSGDGVTLADVERAVRDQLDNTRLTGG